MLGRALLALTLLVAYTTSGAVGLLLLRALSSGKSPVPWACKANTVAPYQRFP